MSRIGITTGWDENYWAGWPWARMMAGSERLATELACALADMGHQVTVRLPYDTPDRLWRGVRWRGTAARSGQYDLLFSFDDFDARDDAPTRILVATRSDPPRHQDFDELIFYSAYHARVVGCAGRPHVGGGVSLADYRTPRKRLPRRVIATGSPDRIPRASLLGRSFDFVASYRPVPGLPTTVELDRAGLLALQQTAQVQIHPLEPVRPSEMFGMALLEAMAAGTPVITTDADAMVELWADSAVILPLPIDYGLWSEQTESLLTDRTRWNRLSRAGRETARGYDWPIVASRFMEVAQCR